MSCPGRLILKRLKQQRGEVQETTARRRAVAKNMLAENALCGWEAGSAGSARKLDAKDDMNQLIAKRKEVKQ